MDISKQIHEQIGKKIKEQLSKVEPEIGAFRKIENLRNILKALFPNETQLDNDATTIAFLNRFLTEDEIIIRPEFTNNKTRKTYPAYTIPDPNFNIIKTKDKGNDKANKEKKDIFFHNSHLRYLANLAQNEVWKFADDKEDNTYPLLQNYLELMFSRLKYEQEVLGKDCKIVEAVVKEFIKKENITKEIRECAFNTGLLSKDSEPIFLVLRENDRPNEQKWMTHRVGVNTAGDRHLIPFKQNLPRRADFSSNLTPSVALFSKPIDAVNVDHMLSHCERLPLEFLRYHFKDYFDKTTPKTDKDWDLFKEYLKNSDNVREANALRRELEAAIKNAVNEGQAHTKKALIYRPEYNTIGTFIPLYLGEKPKDEKDFEIGLIVDKSDGNNIVRTIYRTSMAYTKIRVISQQSQSWLDPTRINRWENPYPYNDED